MSNEQTAAIKVAIVYSGMRPEGQISKIANLIKSNLENEYISVNNYFISENTVYEDLMDELDECKMIILGTTVYMGSIHSQMKIFEEKTSKRWPEQKWKDKLAAGFVHSGSPDGDKFNALMNFVVFACQHSMNWVSLGFRRREIDLEGRKIYVNKQGASVGLTTYCNFGEQLESHEDNLITTKLFGERLQRVLMDLLII